MEMFLQNSAPTILIVAAVAILFPACAVFIPYLKKRGVNVPATLESVSIGLDSADKIADMLKTIFPANPVVNVVDKVIDYAEIGVAEAEQLYRVNDITKDERKQAAIEFVYQSLRLAGYELTPELEKITAGAIEAAVLGLGHGPDRVDEQEGFGGDTLLDISKAEVNA